MDRRLFLTGLVGLAGAAAAVATMRPGEALAGVPDGRGVLDQLDGPMDEAVATDGEATVDLVRHREWHRPRRRWTTRRVCRRVWINGRRRVRCWRQRVRILW